MKIDPMFPAEPEVVEDELVEEVVEPSPEEAWPKEVLLLTLIGTILSLTILFN